MLHDCEEFNASFPQLQRSADGFSVVAEYFGRGVFSKVGHRHSAPPFSPLVYWGGGGGGGEGGAPHCIVASQ